MFLPGDRLWDALDLFGFSKPIESVWTERGFSACALDVALEGDNHDILGKQGWFTWLTKLMELCLGEVNVLVHGTKRDEFVMSSLRRHHGMVVAGPPCSLWVWISSGTHKRTHHRLHGDIELLSVRMSNAIVRNFVALLHGNLFHVA